MVSCPCPAVLTVGLCLSRLYTYHFLLGESDARNTKTQCTVEKYLDLELEFDLFRPILILL